MNKRNKIYLALNQHFLPQHRAALAAIPILLSPLAIQAEETALKWECGNTSDGSWRCVQKTVSGKQYARPYHQESPRAPADEGPDVRVSRNLDWVDEQYLNDAQKAALAPGCCGSYVEPERDYQDSDKDPDDAPVRLAASTTEVMADEVARLEGGVQITQGYRQVRGDSALVDQQNRYAEINGNVQLREPGVLLLSNSAQVNLDTNESELHNATYVFHEQGIRGTADKLEKTSSQHAFVIDNATYTTCEPGNNAWHLAASRVNLDTEKGVGTARNVKLKVKGVPIIYLPWMRFPIDDERTSGLLFPHLEVGDDNGVDFAQPIYLNLAPNYDATITPRYVQERGAALELEGRHLSPLTETVIGGSFLSDDDGGDDPDDTVRENAGEDRWIARIDHTGGFGKNWRTLIDYTNVSDPDYLRDLDTATLATNSRTHAIQRAEVGYLWNNWDFSASSFQLENLTDNLNNDDYEIDYRVAATGNYQFGGSWFSSLKNEYTSFDHDQELFSNNQPIPTGDRVHLEYDLSWERQWAWGYVKPSVGVNHISYDLDNTAALAETSPSATVPVVSFDTGIFLERNTSWIGDFIQTFEPRLYGLYVEFEDQTDFPEFDTTERTFTYNQLFSDNRFVGGDRIGDAQQVSLGITSRLLDPDSGRELFRVSLGQAYFFEDRRVFLNNFAIDDNEIQLGNIFPQSATDDETAYASELAFSLGNNWSFTSDLLFDSNSIDKGSVAFRYKDAESAIFNIGYRYDRRPERFLVTNQAIDTDIQQSDISAYLPISGNWNLVGRWNYDFTNSRELEIFAGFEYNSCCWRISLLARQWIDQDDSLLIPEDQLEDDNGIFLQIQFKGLGGTGTKVDDILSDGIFGYDATRYDSRY